MFYLLYKHQCNPKPFQFRYASCHLLLDHSNGDLFTCNDNMLFSRLKMSCLRAKAPLVFIGFDMIKVPIFLTIYLSVYLSIYQIYSAKPKSGASSSLDSANPGQARILIEFCHFAVGFSVYVVWPSVLS